MMWATADSAIRQRDVAGVRPMRPRMSFPYQQQVAGVEYTESGFSPGDYGGNGPGRDAARSS